MKSLNAKRIAAVAASLVMGLAVAGSGVTFGNIPVINNQGQPVVQIVVGHAAQPSDGVVAANIAAVIGNLAVATQNVTATVNVNTAGTGVHCVVTAPKCTLTNQQVWLGESGISAPSGSYSFGALIGSVINRAVQLSVPASTKGLSSASSQYAYPDYGTSAQVNLQATPSASAYSTLGGPISASVQTSNGGGLTFTGFVSGTPSAGSPGGDNILQISNAQLPSLLSNYGGQGESEYLWIAGFPVFNQQSGVNNFQLVGAQGAYQITFNKPIQRTSSTGATNINVPIRLLGENWTIVNETGSGVSTTVPTSNAISTSAGAIWLASSLTPLQTVYVGHNVSNSSVDGFNVQLTDLGQPNSNGVSTAALDVFYNGQLTNTTQVAAFSTAKFNVTGHTLYVHVNQTFAGLYAYQKWAKIQLYANQFLVQDSKQFNMTGDKGWYTKLLWTNSSTGGTANALQSIIIYNNSEQNLGPGGSLTFIPNPQAYKLTFVGDNLGNNYDGVTATLGSNTGSMPYYNLGTQHATGTPSVTNITEYEQTLQIASSIPGAFSYPGQSSNATATYLLNPYQLNEVANAVVNNGNPVNTVNVVYAPGGAANGGLTANWVTANNPLYIQVTGYASNTATSATTEQVFNSPTLATQAQGITTMTILTGDGANAIGYLDTPLWNVTGIQIKTALPSGLLSVDVNGNTLTAAGSGNSLATLKNYATPVLIYPNSGSNNNYQGAQAGNIVYNQQNGQATTTWFLTQSTTGGPQFFTFNVVEINVPTNTASQDQLSFGIQNTTAYQGGVKQATSGVLYQLNYSAATNSKNNMTYTSSTGSQINAAPGFRTERGSKVGSYSGSPAGTALNLQIAKAVDNLVFVVSPVSSSSNTISTTSLYGPYTVGQQTNLANVTIGKVNATCSFTTTNCSISGVNNLTATPSVKTAVEWPNGKPLNTATTPLAVLDANATNSSTLIVVGSAYVNSVAGQIFANNPQFASSFDTGPSGPNSVTVQAFGNNRILVAGYTAQQTVQAGNQFINQLLAQASAP